MRNLTLNEISESDNFVEFCEMSNLDFTKIASNLGTNLTVALLDEDDEEYMDIDKNYPYVISNPFGIDINKD
jgi:hypothetical protein